MSRFDRPPFCALTPSHAISERGTFAPHSPFMHPLIIVNGPPTATPSSFTAVLVDHYFSPPPHTPVPPLPPSPNASQLFLNVTATDMPTFSVSQHTNRTLLQPALTPCTHRLAHAVASTHARTHSLTHRRTRKTLPCYRGRVCSKQGLRVNPSQRLFSPIASDGPSTSRSWEQTALDETRSSSVPRQQCVHTPPTSTCHRR